MSRFLFIIPFLTLVITTHQSQADVSKGELFAFVEQILPSLACQTPAMKCATHVTETQCLSFIAPAIKNCSSLFKATLPESVGADVENAVIHQIGQCTSNHFMEKFAMEHKKVMSCMQRAQK